MVPASDLIGCESGFIALTTRNGDMQRYKAFPLRCKSWDCPTCAKIKSSKVQTRMLPLFDGRPLYMYTFTYYHNASPLDVWASYNKAWNRFRTAATKKYGGFNYVRILEHHHCSPYPHLHVIADVDICHTWLAKELVSAGFGYQCKKAAVTSDNASTYVRKYLTKPWDDLECKAIRKALRLRVVSFGGDDMRNLATSTAWDRLAMALGCGEILEQIHRDVEWRFGQDYKVSYESSLTDSYELSIILTSEVQTVARNMEIYNAYS